jgi:hypothetical protein
MGIVRMPSNRRHQSHNNPDQWRARARQARELALTTVDRATLTKLERRAVEYEQLAEALERDPQLSA